MSSGRFLEEHANFLGLPAEHACPDTAGVIVLSVPFEESSTFGRGSAAGPQAILDASHEVELYDAALGFEPYAAAGGIASREPLDLQGLDAATVAEELRKEAGSWLDTGKFVVTIGGEHTSIVGAAQAHTQHLHDVTVLHLDAHSDLRLSYQDDAWNHACAAARILDFHDHIVQAGIRSQAIEERAISRERSIPVFDAHEIHAADQAGQDWIAPVIAATRPNVYLTFDFDVFDPAVIPATGTPEPGGLSWNQVDALLARLCRERHLAGADFSELAPVEGLAYPQFTAAKLIARLIGYRFAPEQPPR